MPKIWLAALCIGLAAPTVAFAQPTQNPPPQDDTGPAKAWSHGPRPLAGSARSVGKEKVAKHARRKTVPAWNTDSTGSNTESRPTNAPTAGDIEATSTKH